MQKYLAIFILIILSGCSYRYESTTVSIVGWSDNTEVVRGMGVRLHNGTILTSEHVVPDDRYSYRIGADTYTVIDRDSARDTALLNRDAMGMCCSGNYLVASVEVGESIWSQVYRSGALVNLTGSIIDPSAVVIGYDSMGKTRTLSGIVITTIPFLPGDSGAPIYNSRGELVDVVHISREK